MASSGGDSRDKEQVPSELSATDKLKKDLDNTLGKIKAGQGLDDLLQKEELLQQLVHIAYNEVTDASDELQDQVTARVLAALKKIGAGVNSPTSAELVKILSSAVEVDNQDLDHDDVKNALEYFEIKVGEPNDRGGSLDHYESIDLHAAKSSYGSAEQEARTSGDRAILKKLLSAVKTQEFDMLLADEELTEVLASYADKQIKQQDRLPENELPARVLAALEEIEKGVKEPDIIISILDSPAAEGFKKPDRMQEVKESIGRIVQFSDLMPEVAPVLPERRDSSRSSSMTSTSSSSRSSSDASQVSRESSGNGRNNKTSKWQKAKIVLDDPAAAAILTKINISMKSSSAVFKAQSKELIGMMVNYARANSPAEVLSDEDLKSRVRAALHSRKNVIEYLKGEKTPKGNKTKEIEGFDETFEAVLNPEYSAIEDVLGPAELPSVEESAPSSAPLSDGYEDPDDLRLEIIASKMKTLEYSKEAILKDTELMDKLLLVSEDLVRDGGETDPTAIEKEAKNRMESVLDALTNEGLEGHQIEKILRNKLEENIYVDMKSRPDIVPEPEDPDVVDLDSDAGSERSSRAPSPEPIELEQPEDPLIKQYRATLEEYVALKALPNTGGALDNHQASRAKEFEGSLLKGDPRSLKNDIVQELFSISQLGPNGEVYKAVSGMRHEGYTYALVKHIEQDEGLDYPKLLQNYADLPEGKKDPEALEMFQKLGKLDKEGNLFKDIAKLKYGEHSLESIALSYAREDLADALNNARGGAEQIQIAQPPPVPSRDSKTTLFATIEEKHGPLPQGDARFKKSRGQGKPLPIPLEESAKNNKAPLAPFGREFWQRLGQLVGSSSPANGGKDKQEAPSVPEGVDPNLAKAAAAVGGVANTKRGSLEKGLGAQKKWAKRNQNTKTRT